MKVTIIYGSDGGATKAIASRIGKRIEGRVVNVAQAKTSDFEDCDLLILGVPTYGLGDLQTDWEGCLDTLKAANLANKKVALFGTGDQVNYADSFVDAMGILYNHVVEQGATVVGFTDTEGYEYSASAAERDGRFVGLALDQDNQSSKSDKRITAWISQLM